MSEPNLDRFSYIPSWEWKSAQHTEDDLPFGYEDRKNDVWVYIEDVFNGTGDFPSVWDVVDELDEEYEFARQVLEEVKDKLKGGSKQWQNV